MASCWVASCRRLEGEHARGSGRVTLHRLVIERGVVVYLVHDLRVMVDRDAGVGSRDVFVGAASLSGVAVV